MMSKRKNKLSRFWQGLNSNTILESLRVLIEEQQADRETPTVTLATSSVQAGWERSRPLIMSEANGRVWSGRKADRFAREQDAGLVRGKRVVGCPGREGWRVVRGKVGHYHAGRLPDTKAMGSEFQGYQSRIMSEAGRVGRPVMKTLESLACGMNKNNLAECDCEPGA